MNIFQSLRQRARARRLAEFHAWYQSTQAAALQWTAAKCDRCGTPASGPYALFCAQCGQAFQLAIPSPSQPQPPKQEQTTDPLIVMTERPFLDYLHKQHPDTGPRTEQHRAIHLSATSPLQGRKERSR